MNLKTILIFLGVTLGVLGGVGALLWQFGTASSKPIEDIAGEMIHIKGSGKIKVVEFSDFQCPACASVNQPLAEILSKYESSVTFVYRHFPLTSIHKHALLASYAAEAAHNQGKFFEYGEVLFKTQAEWSGLADPKAKFVEYATNLGLETNRFETDLTSDEVKNRVSIDQIYANKNALTGTPSFFVNGALIDFANLEAKLAELSLE